MLTHKEALFEVTPQSLCPTLGVHFKVRRGIILSKADDKVTFFVKSASWVSSGLAVSLAGSDLKSH